VEVLQKFIEYYRDRNCAGVAQKAMTHKQKEALTMGYDRESSLKREEMIVDTW